LHLSKIQKSYEQASLLYDLFWQKQKDASLHFGYWDAHTKNLSQALALHKTKLIEFAEIKEVSKVLDMGCGVGGGAFFLAENYHAEVLGVNISTAQLKEARIYAEKKGLQEKVRFLEADYLHTDLPDNSYDLIWAVESFFHCIDKEAFIQEAFRLLKPQGKLVMADYFIKNQTKTAKDKKLMDTWFEGFHIPNMFNEKLIRDTAEYIGFKSAKFKDVSQQVLPSSKRLYQLGNLGSIAGKSIQWLPKSILKKLPFQLAHTKATVAQYQALKNGLWQYGFVCMEN